MSLSSPGIGSGLDVKTLVDALVKAEITPLQTRHDNQLSSVNTELSAVGQLKSSLASLQTSLNNLSDISNFYNMKYSVSNTDFLSATLTPQAVKGTYQVEIQKLAQQQSLASGYLNTTSVGSGSITINFGTYNANKTTFTANASATPVTVTIAPGSDSLIAVRDAINNTNSGVTASIVTDNQGSRLTLTSSKTGENYAMQVNSNITALKYDPTIGNNDLTETIAAQNSVVKINGLTLTQSTNQLQDAISGVTLNLKKAELGTITTFTVDDNKDQLTTLVNDFVKKYNDSITLLTNLTGYNKDTKQSGIFQGDPQFRNLKLNLSKWATSPLSQSTNPIQSLADLGITTTDNGLLEINQDKYNAALSTNYANIGALFAKTATATDSNIRINSVGAGVPAGKYDVSLTQFTPGVSMSGTIGTSPATSTDGVTLNGSSELSGLSIKVLSGSTGARGKVAVNDGIAVLMNQFLDSYMDATTGDLDQRTKQLNKQVTELGKTQTQIDARSVSVQNRYLKQFNALDVLLTQMQSTSSFLTQQLAALPKLTTK
ncbi:flagellar filament capping protein FliD [Legionella maioricensis]|uniref:Flagellar hook-associated protein 2 n=1 Tax=Legionella maioricensis TaxID=2896528 RepID=A0A9X2IBV7_9GAMM|nr:flagellar filament capping protein FliD [Legionella maioricensis]MCL9684636.1 flagellar filament capping protein FliD [Legionella maioricensis]MCL9687416.1 flagellar filament capping protein FliD [Legionella maioricensis]